MTTAVAVKDGAAQTVAARHSWHARLVAWVQRHPKLATLLVIAL